MALHSRESYLHRAWKIFFMHVFFPIRKLSHSISAHFFRYLNSYVSENVVNKADCCIQVLGGWYGSKKCLNCIFSSISGMAIGIAVVPVPPAMVHADDRHRRSNIVGCIISCSFYLSACSCFPSQNVEYIC